MARTWTDRQKDAMIRPTEEIQSPQSPFEKLLKILLFFMISPSKKASVTRVFKDLTTRKRMLFAFPTRWQFLFLSVYHSSSPMSTQIRKNLIFSVLFLKKLLQNHQRYAIMMPTGKKFAFFKNQSEA